MKDDFLKMVNPCSLDVPPNWIPPTPTEIRALKDELLPEGEQRIDWMAEAVGANYKLARNAFSNSAYEKGTRVDFSIWRLWLQMLNVVKPYKMNPRLEDIYEGVFSDEDFTPPMVFEFQYIARRSGLAADTIAKYLYMPPEVLKHLLTVNGGKKITDEFRVPKDIWLKFLVDIGFPTYESLFDVGNVLIDPASLLDVRTGEYVPPHPRSIRRLVAYTGYSLNELCDLFDMNVGKFAFYMSNRSMRSDASFTDGIFKTGGEWVAPAIRDLRLFCLLTNQDPREMIRALKLDAKETLAALNTPDTTAWKHEPLDGILDKDLWFKYVNAKVKHVSDLFRLLKKENKVTHIPYSLLRMILSAFGLVDQQDYFHKF